MSFIDLSLNEGERYPFSVTLANDSQGFVFIPTSALLLQNKSPASRLKNGYLLKELCSTKWVSLHLTPSLLWMESHRQSVQRSCCVKVCSIAFGVTKAAKRCSIYMCLSPAGQQSSQKLPAYNFHLSSSLLPVTPARHTCTNSPIQIDSGAQCAIPDSKTYVLSHVKNITDQPCRLSTKRSQI